MVEKSRTSLRDRRRAEGQQEVRDVAMRLFVEHGYAATTVAQITEAAGVSPRTFFRWFRSKEDVLVDAPVGYEDLLAATCRARPAAESAWEALTRTLHVRVEHWQQRPDDARTVLSLIEGSPELTARMSGKGEQWREALVTAVTERLEPAGADGALRARVLVGVAVACLDAAFREWQVDPEQSLGTLFEKALGLVGPSRS